VALTSGLSWSGLAVCCAVSGEDQKRAAFGVGRVAHSSRPLA
jgi:hypothetical protein